MAKRRSSLKKKKASRRNSMGTMISRFFQKSSKIQPKTKRNKTGRSNLGRSNLNRSKSSYTNRYTTKKINSLRPPSAKIDNRI